MKLFLFNIKEPQASEHSENVAVEFQGIDCYSMKFINTVCRETPNGYYKIENELSINHSIAL